MTRRTFTSRAASVPALLSALGAETASAQAPASPYKLGPDSERQPNVPKGTVTKHSFAASKVFPGTERDYWIYVPSQYKPSQPACLMVFQDGQSYATEEGQIRLPVVFDNLIHKGEMPVTIALMISPGVMPAQTAEHQARYNRSYEYDSVSDRYARFVIDEMIPLVTKDYSISPNPDHRGICGQSSGGICALTAAFFRPDAFRRVISFIGSFTNLKGGHEWAVTLRKFEPRPLRVFLQDGSNDNNIYAGSWWIGNQDVDAALEHSGYEHTFITGTESHNMRHGGAVFPDALRWAWKDYPKPVSKGKGKGDRHFVSRIVDLDRDWEEVSAGHGFTEGPAVAPDGTVFFTDVRGSKIHKISPAGKSELWMDATGGANGMMFGADGRMYVAQNGKKRIVSFGMDKSETVLAENVTSNDLVVLPNGRVYFTDPPNKKVWLIDEKRNLKEAASGFEFPNGVVTSPDHSLLIVADMRTRYCWSYQIRPDGSLVNGQPFYRMEVFEDPRNPGGDGMTTDSEGYLYVATSIGLQVCDQPGRVVGVVSKPHAGTLSNTCFGGPELDWLYVTAGDRVFRRMAKRRGVWPWKPQMPPKPGL